MFSRPSNDAFYRATSPHRQSLLPTGEETAASDNYTFWRSDEPISPIACLGREQFCDSTRPLEEGCTPLRGHRDSRLQTLGRPAFQNDTRPEWEWALGSVQTSRIDINEVVSTLQAQSLASRSYYRNGVQGYLEENQWQLDAERWFATTLASLQLGLADIAAGPTLKNADLAPFTVRPNGPAEESVCQNQVSRVSCSVAWVFQQNRHTWAASSITSS